MAFMPANVHFLGAASSKPGFPLWNLAGCLSIVRKPANSKVQAAGAGVTRLACLGRRAPGCGVWAALESMAARLITECASDAEIASLRRLFTTFEGEEVGAHIDEYSERNIDFHSRLLQLSKCGLLNEMANNLFIHMRSIRARTISEDDRAKRSIIDHIHIIEALEARDAGLAERLVREHTLNLAAHVDANVDYLD